MSLSVISNYAANVAHRYLGASDMAATSSLAKLSSGQRIVSAKDDAAGLAIGSRLALQVTALQQDATNATQATSMLQVSDGALSKIGDILTRMKTLAVQAQSGQLGSTERGMIDTEYQGLLSEIDRISNDTTFNGVTLLAGTSSSATKANTATTNYIDAGHGVQSITYDNTVTDATNPGAFFSFSYDSSTNVLTAKNLRTGVSQGVNINSTAIATNATQVVNFTALGTTVTLDSAFSKTTSFLPTGHNSGGAGQTGAIVGSSIVVTSATAGYTTANVMDTALTTFTNVTGSIDATTAAATKLTFGGFTGTADMSSTGVKTITLTNGTAASADSFSLQFVVSTAFVSNATNTGTITLGDLGTISEATNQTSATSFTYQVGPGTTTNDTITVSLNQITTTGLGVNGTSVTGATNANANTASTDIDAAMNTLNTARANVGGAQSRLGFAAANLATATENSDAARSSLLDLDVASEMSVFTSKQILEQTGISMLAQANRMPENLLKLFQ